MAYTDTYSALNSLELRTLTYTFCVVKNTGVDATILLIGTKRLYDITIVTIHDGPILLENALGKSQVLFTLINFYPAVGKINIYSQLQIIKVIKSNH